MERDWWVYSTVIEGRAILVEDRNTGELGCIVDATKDEWRRAFHAPSQPYQWTEPARVVVDGAAMATAS